MRGKEAMQKKSKKKRGRNVRSGSWYAEKALEMIDEAIRVLDDAIADTAFPDPTDVKVLNQLQALRDRVASMWGVANEHKNYMRRQYYKARELVWYVSSLPGGEHLKKYFS